MTALELITVPFFSQTQAYRLGLGALIGLFIHHALFIHGEWHTQAPLIVLVHLLTFTFLLASSICSRNLDVHSYFQGANLISISYCVALFTSITIYRLVFHRLTLARFPGPLCARVTKLWHVWMCRTSCNHLVLADLQRKYGDFVRTGKLSDIAVMHTRLTSGIGPSEITVFHPEVFWAIDGPKTECIKSDWYDILHPNRALVTARVKSSHQTRRRQWNRGFSSKCECDEQKKISPQSKTWCLALDQYEEKILKYIDQFDSCVEADATAQRSSNARDLFFWFGFDSMGDFVFNKSFNMLEVQRWHHIVILLQRALSLLGYFSPAPWLVQVGFKLFPRVWVLKDWFDMVDWCEEQMRERIEVLSIWCPSQCDHAD